MKISALSPFLLVAAGCAASPAEAPVATGGARTPTGEAPSKQAVHANRPETMLDLLRWYEETEGGNFAFTQETMELLESIEFTAIGEDDIEVFKIAVRGT